jgi:predicted Zn finger-like uncharacterized protein
MPISVECPSCLATFRVKEEYAGKRGRCPSCKGLVAIPSAPASPQPEPGPEDDGTGGYALAGSGATKAKMVPVRAGALPAVGVGAETGKRGRESFMNG